MSSTARVAPVGALLAAAGPIALGAVVGAQAGGFAAARAALALPAVIFGLMAAMVPALYIGVAVAGSAPAARDVAIAAGRGLRSCGVALLGVTAPLLFLFATSASARLPVVLGGMALAGAAVAGLWALGRALFAGAPARWQSECVFVAWSLLALGIGMRLYVDVVSP